eukprot:183976_1
MSNSTRNNRDKLDELIVSGYIREHPCAIKIPMDVIGVCYQFFHAPEIWNLATTNHLYTITEQILTLKETSHDYPNAFGFDSITKPMIKTWKIQYIEGNLKKLLIGIIPSSKASNSMYASFPWNRNGGLGLYAGNGYVYRQSQKIFYVTEIKQKENPLISMTLDLSTKNKFGTLSYAINGKQHGIAFCDLDINKHWTLAVAATEPLEIELIQ